VCFSTGATGPCNTLTPEECRERSDCKYGTLPGATEPSCSTVTTTQNINTTS
jgi:hypothetical protein